MHFHAGKESALRELLNNVQNKLSEIQHEHMNRMVIDSYRWGVIKLL